LKGCSLVIFADAGSLLLVDKESDRPYRKAMSHNEAFTELQRNKGKQLDPELVDAFIEGFKRG
jgi:HD-GYP domain-containing protein (c-di-GMP phosphodiesterase class II)